MRTRSLLPVTALTLLLFPACSSSGQPAYAGEGGRDGASLGSVMLASPKAGHVTFHPAICSAGDDRMFLGGDFTDEEPGMTLRFVLDPLYGPAVRVFSTKAPDERSVVFRKPECRTFRFQLERTGLTVNDVDEYRISLDLDCATGDGKLTAKVAGASCL